MAIQVNGTTVIDNSRNLTNIASVDATTVSALGAAGVGGSASWNTEGTYTNNTEHSGTYSSGSSLLGTLPSSKQVSAFGVQIKFDAKVTTNTGSSQWNCKFTFSNTNSMSSNSYFLFGQWDYTGGYMPSINAYYTVNYSKIYMINPNAYNMSTGAGSAAFGQSTGGIYYGDNTSSSAVNTSPERLIFSGAWAYSDRPNLSASNFPSFTPSSSIYSGFHLNWNGSYGSGYIRNVSIKLIALY